MPRRAYPQQAASHVTCSGAAHLGIAQVEEQFSPTRATTVMRKVARPHQSLWGECVQRANQL